MINLDKCVRCGICLTNCPIEAIDWVKTDGGYVPKINTKCNQCGTCVKLCPCKAIEPLPF